MGTHRRYVAPGPQREHDPCQRINHGENQDESVTADGKSAQRHPIVAPVICQSSHPAKNAHMIVMGKNIANTSE